MNVHGLYAEVQHMLELSLSNFHALPPYSERDYCSDIARYSVGGLTLELSQIFDYFNLSWKIIVL